jgi:transposase
VPNITVQVGEVEDQHIRIALALPEVRVIAQQLTTTGVEVVVERVTTGAHCPRCAAWTVKRHDQRRRAKLDEPLADRQVTVIVVRRRFRCLPCNIVFTEPDSVCGTRRRLTRRLRARLGHDGSRRPVAHVATTYGVSATTVQRAITEHAATTTHVTAPAIVQRLGLDDFSLRRGRRYATGLHDLDTHRLIDVVEGRTSADVQPALERLPTLEQIRVVSIDMARAYRAAVQLVLPAAVITVDKFHVVKRIHEALAAVWRRLVKGKGRTDPLRQDGRLVLRNREELTEAAWARLTPLLHRYPSLRHAWLLKEDLRRWYHTATAMTARLELRAWEGMVSAAVRLPEFQALRGMLTEWREEILSYFATRVTQGVVEGNNNRAKVIQRQGYGYRNFHNYRLRLLLAA